MFSNRTQLEKRTPENGTDRESFLSLLVDEYLNTTSYNAKCQVIANLTNFAYDPINYTYIRDVGVLDIFLHVVKNEDNSKLLNYATAGICNLCIDPANASHILTHLGLRPIIGLLKDKTNEIVANAITTLIYLFNKQTDSEIKSALPLMSELSKSEDRTVANLAKIFLEEICVK